MTKLKVWYKDSDPTKVISFNKSVGGDSESYLEVAYPDNLDADSWDMEFYEINQGPPQVLNRKAQGLIDAIVVARAQIVAGYAQKQTDAKTQLTLNDLADKTYAQAEAWIEDTVTDLPSAKVVLKKMAKIILAMLKKGDFSD